MMSLLGTAIAGLTLLGWVLDIEILKQWIPGSVGMNPLTAMTFLLANTTLWLQLSEAKKRYTWRQNLLIPTFALATALIGLIKLFQYGFDIQIGIDRLLFSQSVSQNPGYSLSPNTAFGFILSGLALLFLIFEKPRWERLSEIVAIFIVLNSYVAVAGHTVQSPALYSPLPFIGMAIHTAICFILLSLGIIFSNPDRGLASIVSSPYLGGNMARRILPFALLVILFLGWLRMWGERRAFYDSPFGIGLMILLASTILVIVTLNISTFLNTTDAKRQQAEGETRLIAQRLGHALQISQAAIISVDQQQRIVFFDEIAQKIFGYTPNEVLGRQLDLLLPTRFHKSHRQYIHDFDTSSEEARIMGLRRDVFGRRKDGTEFPAEAGISRSHVNSHPVFTAVVRDISERKRAEEETLRSERLEAANKELESFSYSVSHDLRAPLRAIVGFSKILIEDHSATLDQEGKRILGVVIQNTQKMSRLIDDLLAFSRFSRQALSGSSIPMKKLVEAVWDDIKSEKELSDVRFTLGDLPDALGDSPLIRQVVFNLLSNAVKYSWKKGKIAIEVEGRTEGNENVYSIKDNGAGFDMAYAAKLFGVFQRLHPEEEFEGTGVGLAIVQRIIHRHGGRVWAKGKVGEGAIFYFTLPKISSPGGNKKFKEDYLQSKR